MHTAENFQTFNYLGSAVPAEPVAPGLLFELHVDSQYRNRYIWLAAGSWFQAATTEHWFVLGRLEFYIAGKMQGKFEFCDSSDFVDDAERALAPRALTRIRPDGIGSTQPVLKFEYFTNSGTRNNCDIPAFCFPIFCDRIQYHVEKTFTTGAAILNPFRLVLGCKIVSTI